MISTELRNIDGPYHDDVPAAANNSYGVEVEDGTFLWQLYGHEGDAIAELRIVEETDAGDGVSAIVNELNGLREEVLRLRREADERAVAA